MKKGFELKCKAVGFVAMLAFVGMQSQARGDILGSAHGFAVLGGSTVTNTGPTIVTGDVGSVTITGFPPGIVVGGTLQTSGAVVQQARADFATAYNALAAMAVTQTLTGMDLGGRTLTPGVYFFASSAGLSSTLTLDALGNPNAVFVFQIGSTLTTATSSSVVTINGASGGNVYWQVGSSATIGTHTAFKGNILAQASITLTTGATILDGRAFARDGAVTMDSNTITAAARCRADADGNGQIQTADVSFFVSTWFNSLSQGTLAGDFNRDGAVAPSDVSLFVSQWYQALNGPCPQ